MTNLFDLTGKVAVITGASSGLGADAALALAEAGADVAILARRENKLQEVKETIINKTGRKVLAVECDVCNEEKVQAAVQKVIGEFGHIDILLNNAGVAVRGGVDSMTVEQWDTSFDTNVKSIFICKIWH